jgi:homoprotocatechuate degradation regulator HpaR
MSRRVRREAVSAIGAGGDGLAAADHVAVDADRFALPASTRRSLPMALLRARELVMTHFRPMLARHDVTEQQWRVIRVLSETGPLGATDLAERASILGPSLTRIAKGLEARGLITTERLADDGRRVVLTVTPAGAALIDAAASERSAIYRAMEARHGREWLERLLDQLETLIDRELSDAPVATGSERR